MRIEENEDAYRVYFFPDAKDDEVRDEWSTRGIRYVIGQLDDGDHVPKYVDYDKNRFTVEKTIALAKNIKECPICKSKDEHVDEITSVDLLENPYEKHLETASSIGTSTGADASASTNASAGANASPGAGNGASAGSSSSSSGIDFFRQAVTDLFLKTHFSLPGLFILGSILDDSEMLNLALPQNPSDEAQMGNFIAELSEVFAGEKGIVRSKKDMMDFANAVRPKPEADGNGDSEEEEVKVMPLSNEGFKTIISILD